MFCSSAIWILILILVQYVLVLFAVIADLIAGVRKAKKRGEARRSAAFRRTVDKIARYYNALFALTVIDLMQIGAVFYLRIAEGFVSLPLFPIFTLIGSIGIALIEVKSIFEKGEEKERNDTLNAFSTLSKLIHDKDFINLISSSKQNKP